MAPRARVMLRRFVHTREERCDWCNGTGLGGDYGGGPCYGCSSHGTITFEDLLPTPPDDLRTTFAAVDLDAAEALALEALARAAVWTGTSFSPPPASTWCHARSLVDAAWARSSSLRASLERLERAGGGLPAVESRGDLLRAASAAYARLGDALDPFAVHLELLARGVAVTDDSDTLVLVI